MHNYIPKSQLLKNRVILITGASKGIGRVIAKSYAKHGATVILLARSLKNLEDLYDEIEHLGYPKPAIYPFNLATAAPKDYEDLATNLETHFGRLDGLLHNAATLGSLTPIEHYPLEQWYQVLQINLNSAYLLSQTLLPLLKKSNDASIIFTEASIGQISKAYWGAYGVSKLAIHAFMQILADELNSNTHIRVNSINPGKVNTELRMNAYPMENKKNIPSPELITPCYLYLMGPDSIGVNGQCFNLKVKSLATL